MQIQSGKLYENRTWIYLYPSLKYYGDNLMNHLSSFIKLAVGIGDSNLKVEGNCIFILVDTSIKLSSDLDRLNYQRNFSKFLDWVRYQYYYVTDYVYDNLDKSEKHMIVLKVPLQLDSSYVHFVKGEYSEMYNKEQLNKLFNVMNNVSNNPSIAKRNERVSYARKVLTKDKKYLPLFVDKVNKDFGTDITLSDYKDVELDYPINLEEEIF